MQFNSKYHLFFKDEVITQEEVTEETTPEAETTEETTEETKGNSNKYFDFGRIFIPIHIILYLMMSKIEHS